MTVELYNSEFSEESLPQEKSAEQEIDLELKSGKSPKQRRADSWSLHHYTPLHLSDPNRLKSLQ